MPLCLIAFSNLPDLQEERLPVLEVITVQSLTFSYITALILHCENVELR